MEEGPNAGLDAGSAFPQTHWTLIFGAGSADPRQAQQALEKLCALYRQPIVNWFARHAERQDAEDLAHSFIAYLLAKEVLPQLRERKGRFRFFLVTVMRRFLYDTWAKAAAQKRGGHAAIVELSDEQPEPAGGSAADDQFDLDLALEIHRRIMQRLAVPPELKAYLFSKDPATGWEQVAAAIKIGTDALRQRVSRMRRVHWEAFRDEVGQMVSVADKADETRYLYELLFKNLPPEL